MSSGATRSFQDSTPLLEDPAALRARADEDGFLCFRGMLSRSLVLELRRQFLEVLARFGWLAQDGGMEGGLIDREAVDGEDPVAMVEQGVGINNAAYAEIQKLELFHSIPHTPKLIAFYEALFAEEVLVHPRPIARLILPASYNTPTPAHQDLLHIQGTPQAWTCWMPVGDCPREMGNLTLLHASHRKGLLSVSHVAGAGGLESHLCGDNLEWVEGDFEAGDILTFPSLTVHKALKPQVTDRVRLSCDYRFQPASQPIEGRSLLPHGEVITWDDIYAGWQSDELKYYWRRFDLDMAEWDESIRWQKDKIC